MKICYNKLWKLLIDRNMRKIDLQKQAGISKGTVTKLGKNQNVSTETLVKICRALDCEIEDIVGFIECVGKGGGYEIIVLDISTAIRQSWRLMECCNVVYMPIKNDYLSCRKISTLESYYYSMGVDSMIKVIEKVRLPEGENAVDKDFISKITTSGMYRYVKKLLESVLSINNANVK